MDAEEVFSLEELHNLLTEVVDIDDDIPATEENQPTDSNFQEWGTPDFHQGFRAGIGEGAQAGTQTCGEDHSFHGGATFSYVNKSNGLDGLFVFRIAFFLGCVYLCWYRLLEYLLPFSKEKKSFTFVVDPFCYDPVPFVSTAFSPLFPTLWAGGIFAQRVLSGRVIEERDVQRPGDFRGEFVYGGLW